jgi:hypothetical protein
MSYFLPLQNWRTGEQNRSHLGRGVSTSQKWWWGCGRVNTVQTLHTRVFKWRNVTFWNFFKNEHTRERWG